MDEFDDVERSWAKLGWQATELYALELHQVARRLGLRDDGEQDDPIWQDSRVAKRDDDGEASVEARMASNLAEREAAGARRDAERRKAEQEAD